ncbi:DUF4347 domain-containing protein [Zooshikella marina]|uniref:DUF4347 domain-containing protein n=1 Tax=Zooshikella ganghwensis TaxID=202772 RepID=UPI001BAF78BA|nr:DUF4347 domain-containing protein [Zooshikella ganghwensis]MBU2707443.1 DUF4347 domain-containing protein [Zooshikella ganghwensis]
MFKKNTLTVPVMGIELLENRILFDAALGATVDAVEVQHDQASFDQTNFDHAILSNELQITEAPNTIVIIDSRVENSALIEAEFPDAQVFTLSGHYSGVEQIHTILQQFQASETKPQEIILFSHGKPGELLIGSTSLTIDTIIQNYSELLKDIRNLTADNAVLAVYGCDVASTAEGQVDLDTLANLTGLDIAASTDLTGAKTLTGDWELEYTTNSKFVAPVLSAQFQLEYPTTLAAPGNVASANLTLWLKANTGVTESGGTVTNWTDQSAAGGNNSVSQGDNTKQPQRQLSTVNFNPSLRFDGTNDELTRINFQGTEIISNNNNTMFAVVNVFSPGVVAQWEHNDGFARTDRINIEYTAPNNPRFDFSDDVGGKISGPAVSSTYHIVSGVANIPNNSLYVDGLRSGTTGVAPAADNSLFGNLSIGSYPDALGTVNAGMNLSEVIIYNTTLSLADKQKVESYLAVKYGITLDPTDNEGGITEGNYITSTGVTAWDFTANSGYHNNVAGVAIDSGSDLNQLKSKSINSGSAVTIEATSSLDDGDYLMWGSNGASGEISTEMPANSGFSKRLATEWKVQEVQDFVNTTVTFDLTTLGLTGRSSSDFAMVVDTDDGDFSNAFSFVSPSAFDGSTVTFNLGFLNNGFYFTLFTEANTAPTINNLDGDSTTLNPFVIATTTLDQGTSATFTDTTSSNLQDGTLTVQFTAGSDPSEDTLVINNQGVGLGQIGVAGANVTYEGTTIGTFAGGSGGTPLTVNFNTNATPTAVSALLQQIQYTNTDPGSPTLGTRTITFSATDGDGGTSNTATVTLNLANSAPALNNLDGDTQTINPAVTATTALDQAMAATIVDTDSPDFNNGSLVTQFTAGSDPAEDTLVINNQGVGLGQIGVAGANVTYEGTTIGTFAGGSGGTPLTVNFNTNATPTAVSALLQQIQYTNTDPGSPTLGTRTITFSATDGDGGTSNTATVTVNVNNPAPVVSNLDGDNQSITPNVSNTTFLDQGTAGSVTDDAPNFNTGSLTATFTAGSDSTEDVLSINNQGTSPGQIGISGSNVTYGGTIIGTFTGGTNNSPLVITFNANATPVAVTALTQQLQYTNTDTTDPTAGTRSINVNVVDNQGATSNTSTVTITVNNINPTINNFTEVINVNPGDPTTFPLDRGTPATIVDPTSTDFNSGTLTATFVSGLVPGEDDVTLNNQGNGPGEIGVSGSTVSYGGTPIGTFSGGTNGVPLQFNFNSSANPTSVSALLQQITYVNQSPDDPTTGTRIINVVATDGDGGTSNVAVIRIDINGATPNIPTHPTTSGVDGESSGEESEVKPHITPHPTSSPISTTLSPGLAPPSLLSSSLPESLKPATTVSIDGKVVYHPLPHHNYDAERIQHMVFGLTNYDRGDIPNAMTTKVLGEPEATILDLIFVEVEKVHDSWAGYIDHSVQINGQAVTGYGGCVMDAPNHANFSIDAQRGVFNLNLSSGESAKVHLEVYLANGETIEQNVVVDGTTGSVSSMGSGSVNCKPSQATNDTFNNENSFSNQLSRLVATHYEH